MGAFDDLVPQQAANPFADLVPGGRLIPPQNDTISPVTSLGDRMSLAFPQTSRQLGNLSDALFSSKNPSFGTPNSNPATIPQAFKSVGQSLGNSIATPGGFALSALGLEGVNPMFWKALGLGFAPTAGKAVGQGLEQATRPDATTPQRIVGAGEAAQGGLMALGAIAPHLAGLPGQGEVKGPMLTPEQQRILVNQQGAQEYANAQALRSASPTKDVTPQVTQQTQNTAPEIVPSASKEPSTTSSLGMLDQQFRHNVGNAMQVINLHEQTKGLDQVQAAAARGLVKTLALRANQGEDMTAALQDARQRISDVAAYNKNQAKWIAAIRENVTSPAVQTLGKINEDIKNKYGGMPPTIEGVENVSSKAKINGASKQVEQAKDQGLPTQAAIQAAPKEQVPGNVGKPTGGNVVGNEQVNGGQGLAGSSVDKVDKTLGQEAKYPLSTSVHEGKMVDAEGRTVDPKTHKTTGESGFTIAPKEMWDSLFKNKGTKVDPIQMWNTLKNKLGEASGTFKALQSSGLQGFLSGGPKSVQEVESWANENGPKVEVRKFRADYTDNEKEVYNKRGQLEHELDTKYPAWRDRSVSPQYVNNVQFKDLLVKYEEASKAVDAMEKTDTGHTSHWQSIAPKSEQDMPGYVEIAVVKPLKPYVGKPLHAELEKNDWAKIDERRGVQFPSSHNFPPNTLGFVRGYMENVSGKKVFHVIEVQSDWEAQATRARKAIEGFDKNAQAVKLSPSSYGEENGWRVWYKNSDGEKVHADSRNATSAEDAIKKVRVSYIEHPSLNQTSQDPLLPHYERLALKAAIDHARSEGADAIAISDAETAMMTEGHDRTVPENSFDRPSQEEGMRYHYDPDYVNKKGQKVGGSLHNIASELTGQKGEKVSFGEHKMAVDYEHSSPDGSVQAGKTTPRKDLIFRNEQGQPKTDISGRMFDISNAKKEFSLYGRTGSIFPESPLGKALKETGAKEAPNEMVQSALAKLDSVKATGKDIYDAVTSTHAWKSWWLKRQGYDLPKIESISPKFADAVSSYANSQVASVLRANANIAKVLGDKAGNEQFRKQLGGIIYEDMRRAEGDKGNSVLFLKNSPFSSEAQYQAALKNPEMQQALARWKELVQAPATEMHQKLGGQMAESGKQTGAFANLIAVMQDETKEPVANAPTTVGPMSTMKKGSAFSKERKFTGQEYNLDAKDMAFRMMTKNAQQAALRDVYQVGEQEGLLKLLKQGDETPANMIRQKNPVTLRTVVKDGEKFHTSAYPAFDKRVASTLEQALQLNKSMADTLDAPAIHAASQIVIKTQVALGIDLGFHTFNDVVATANSPKGLLAILQKTASVAKAYQDQVAKTPQVQEELARMAEAGVTFRGDSLGGWSSHALKVADTVTRLVLNREYEQLVAEKKVVDSAAERRRYINGRAGQYNKRFMTWFQQGMQESGLGAFNVAGRNFNRLAVGTLTFSPGVKATSKMESLRLRLSIAAGIATAALIVPAVVNTATTGDPRPEGTEFGDIVVGKKKDGTYEVLNMRKWTMLARGGRASGLGAVMNEQVLPRLRGEQPAGLKQTVTDAAKDMGRTALAPFSGPPVNLLSTLLTGKTELGFGYEQRTPGEKAPYVKATIGTLNPLVGPIVNQAGGQTPAERIEQRLGSVVGLQSSQSPFSIMRNRAVQFKARNKIGSDDTQSYGPSEYLPLKNALLQGDVATAKEQYQQLLHEKSQNATLSDEQAKKDAMMMIQKEFIRLQNFRFVNKESEEAFKASLTPQQRITYKTAVDQQKQMADLFFNQIQGKISNEDNGFHFHMSKPSGFKKFK